MKKVLSAILVCVLLLGTVFSLAGCSSVSGEYEADLITSVNTYKFGMFGKVTLTVDPIALDATTYEGKYKINEDTNEITFTFDSEDADLYEGTFDFSSGEEDGEKYVKINYVKYKKVN